MYIQKLIVGSPIMYTVHSFLHMLILFPPPWIYTTKWTAKMYPGRPEYSDILEENWFDSTFFGIPFLLQLPTSPHTHWLYIIWLFKHLMKTFLFFSKHTVRAPDYFALLYATAVKKKNTFGMNRKVCDVWKCHIDWLPCQKEIYLIHFNVAIKIRIECFLGG
jgi:hypothetical protein